MSKVLEYKNYIGSVEFSEEDNILFGKLLGIRDPVSYEGTTIRELVTDFHNAVDDYIYQCESEHKSPDKPCKGSFNVRVAPETHRRATIYALNHGISLNHFVEDCIIEKLR